MKCSEKLQSTLCSISDVSVASVLRHPFCLRPQGGRGFTGKGSSNSAGWSERRKPFGLRRPSDECGIDADPAGRSASRLGRLYKSTGRPVGLVRLRECPHARSRVGSGPATAKWHCSLAGLVGRSFLMQRIHISSTLIVPENELQDHAAAALKNARIYKNTSVDRRVLPALRAPNECSDFADQQRPVLGFGRAQHHRCKSAETVKRESGRGGRAEKTLPVTASR